MIYINGRFLTQPLTGVQRFAYEITGELIKQRDDVVILVPDRPRTMAYEDETMIRVVGRTTGHFWEQIELPRTLRRLKRPLLVNLTSTGPVGYENQISTHHDITYVHYPQSYSRSFRTLYANVVPRLIRRSAALITVSNFSRSELSRHFKIDPGRFTIVPNAASAHFSPAPCERYRGTRYFLAVSSPNHHKNFELMLRAFEDYRRNSGSQTRLFIVGAQATGYSKRMYSTPEGAHFLGRVTDKDLVDLYRGALAFVFPSLYEGFGIPPLEAQSCGCPVVSSSAASMPEVLGDAALYFDPGNMESLVKALESIDTNEAQRIRLRNSGIRNAERFSWSQSAHQVSHMIDNLTQTA